MDTELLDQFSKQGREFLGVRFPFICGAMTWVSEPTLVAAVNDAGGFGCLAGGNLSGHALEQQIGETRRLTNKPFGVNLIAIAPTYREQLAIVGKLKVPFVIFAGSLPRRSEIRMAKESGAKILCFASTRSIAGRMLDYGADALILE